jgi:hypothetical protein
MAFLKEDCWKNKKFSKLEKIIKDFLKNWKNPVHSAS